MIETNLIEIEHACHLRVKPYRIPCAFPEFLACGSEKEWDGETIDCVFNFNVLCAVARRWVGREGG
jgi:hypothetical protein